MDIKNIFSKKPQVIEIQQAPTQLPLKVLKPEEEIPRIGKRNEHIIESLTLTKRVAVHLARSGFHVLDVELGGRNPRIIINPSKRCEMLGGAMIKITKLSRLEVRTMAANIDGVQVEWMVPNNA